MTPEKPWIVECTPGGGFVSDYESKDSATANMTVRNIAAAKLGIKTRYVVKERAA